MAEEKEEEKITAEEATSSDGAPENVYDINEATEDAEDMALEEVAEQLTESKKKKKKGIRITWHNPLPIIDMSHIHI